MTMPDSDEQFDSGYDVEEEGKHWDSDRDLPMWQEWESDSQGGYAP